MIVFNPIEDEVRALSLKDPYATLMLNGKIETRNHPTSYRGLVLIAVSKKVYSVEEINEISGDHFRAVFEGLSNRFLFSGCAIALGRLVDCRLMRPDDEAKCYVKYQFGKYCWIFEDVTELENPFPWKGTQSWKILTPEQKQLIQLKP